MYKINPNLLTGSFQNMLKLPGNMIARSSSSWLHFNTDSNKWDNLNKKRMKRHESFNHETNNFTTR